MNFIRPSCLAVSRTRSSPVDAFTRPCVRHAGGSCAFPLVTPLPSTVSAGFPLLDGFFGTTGVSDFSAASMAALRPLAFSTPSGNFPDTAEISQLLCRLLPDMRRVFDRAGSKHDLRFPPCFMLPSELVNVVGIPIP